ncbi:hypothetical protein [Bacillus chungangensis]|uniref:Uncharacterized protein n=1 Tax=Bacillus chungangensis TaxID=587633 RepID=A0ABT9WT79_9BACI|nr:hypothetical protein [Bacillus chungangensis]MDQ0176496.1 hypothetical protein [Bacillus chungangensis]
MKTTLLTPTKLRPTNHYLDIIAKIRCNGGKISDFYYKETTDGYMKISFQHTYPHSKVIFKEQITYNTELHITNWIVQTNNRTITLYDEIS